MAHELYVFAECTWPVGKCFSVGFRFGQSVSKPVVKRQSECKPVGQPECECFRKPVSKSFVQSVGECFCLAIVQSVFFCIAVSQFKCERFGFAIGKSFGIR